MFLKLIFVNLLMQKFFRKAIQLRNFTNSPCYNEFFHYMYSIILVMVRNDSPGSAECSTGTRQSGLINTILRRELLFQLDYLTCEMVK